MDFHLINIIKEYLIGIKYELIKENNEIEIGYKNSKGGKHGNCKTYENGKIKWTGIYKENRCIGCKSYYKKGQIKDYYKLRNNDCHGEFKEWYKNGNTRTKGYYIHGERYGDFKEWYKNKQLKTHLTYTYGDEGFFIDRMVNL